MRPSAAAERIARIQAPKKLPKAPPWTMALKGTLHVLMADSVTLACLAQGIVPARFQVQCADAVNYLNLLEEEV